MARTAATATAAVATALLTILGACGLLAGCQDQQPPPAMTAPAYIAAAKKVVTELPPRQAAKELADDPGIFLMDCQLYGEYESGHITGAVLIPRGYLEFKIARNDLFPAINRGRVPRSDQPIIVYCTLGSRSLLAVRTLKEMGFANVRSIQGGLEAWTKAGLPIERRAAPASAPGS